MMNNINQVVLILIIANVLVSMKGFNDYSFLNKYKFQVGSILSGEKIRMLSSGFLHAVLVKRFLIAPTLERWFDYLKYFFMLR